MSEAYEEAGGPRSGIQGYCFYHGQDLEWVMQSGELWLAFGHISGEEEQGVEVGRRIKRALEAAGFAVEWDGSIGRRLLVNGIRWQRRGSRTTQALYLTRTAMAIRGAHSSLTQAGYVSGWFAWVRTDGLRLEARRRGGGALVRAGERAEKRGQARFSGGTMPRASGGE